MGMDNARLAKVLVGLAIERALFKEGNPAFEKVEDMLRSKFQCGLMDSYEHPEYLREVLSEIFGKSYTEITNSIVTFLGDFGDENQIEGFLAEINK